MSPSSSARILVVDDNAPLRDMLRLALQQAGFEVLEAADGAEADERLDADRPDLVVLDQVMPRVTGPELLRRWRAQGRDVAVIMVTGHGGEESEAEALESGADDYLPKPVRPRDLVAHVTAVLRRTRALAPSLAVGDVRLNVDQCEAVVKDRAVPLTKTETALLQELMRFPGRILTPDDLLVSVWGPSYAGQADIVRTNVYRLRQKLEEDPRDPRYIQSRTGVGYFFAQPPR